VGEVPYDGVLCPCAPAGDAKSSVLAARKKNPRRFGIIEPPRGTLEAVIANVLQLIAGVFRWVLYGVIGVVSTCILILIVLIGGNSLHLWGQQGSQHVTATMQPVRVPR
jgi:hypothetical protein